VYTLTLENVSKVFERAGLSGKLDMPCGLWLENEEKRKMLKETGKPYLYRRMMDMRSRLDFPSVLLHHPYPPNESASDGGVASPLAAGQPMPRMKRLWYYRADVTRMSASTRTLACAQRSPTCRKISNRLGRLVILGSNRLALPEKV